MCELAADVVSGDVLDDGVVEVVLLWVCSVAKLVFDEKDSFFWAEGAGVQVVSPLRGVLLSADVKDVVGLFLLAVAKNLWCFGHRRTPGPSSVPPGAHSQAPWHI